jgi:excinuclease ABC subunit C
MLDKKANVIYVGKARDLKKRLSNYFRQNIVDRKTLALLEHLHSITVTLTHNENEALLLENTLIKKLQPHYNVLLRDDKSYPYIFLSASSEFPRLDFHRGPQKEKGHYFGPYPSAGSVHETLDVLQKLFKVRQCSDSFFKSRTRPCLQFYIKRCTAPCVGYIDAAAYQQNVHYTELFLQGKNKDILNELASKMERASAELRFEDAARIRDQIISVRRVLERQYVSTEEGDVDVIAIVSQSGVVCIHILFIRGGRLIGGKSYFPKVLFAENLEDILVEFLPQYYLSGMRGESYPKRIIINTKLEPEERQWIQDALSEQVHQKITISDSVRGQYKRWQDMTILNAKQALNSHLSDKMHYYQRLLAFQTLLQLPNLPQRIECFDVSHTMGEATVASCVVFDDKGPVKNAYRRFNITDVTPGDDYAALQQALTRRYTRLKAHDGSQIPDVLIIDGGKGQLSTAEAVIEELQVSGVTLIAVAKGPTRKPGMETLFVSKRSTPLEFSADSPALHLIQQIRDEAHRFAIVGHRQKQLKTRSKSFLENIPGIGAKRRRDLLRHFGGLQEIKNASVDELAKVQGISWDLAIRIYEALH